MMTKKFGSQFIERNYDIFVNVVGYHDKSSPYTFISTLALVLWSEAYLSIDKSQISQIPKRNK